MLPRGGGSQLPNRAKMQLPRAAFALVIARAWHQPHTSHPISCHQQSPDNFPATEMAFIYFAALCTFSASCSYPSVINNSRPVSCILNI